MQGMKSSCSGWSTAPRLTDPAERRGGGKCRPGSYADQVGLYDDVYAALDEADVRYVVVGGMAVVMSGHVRATVDLDVVVDLEPAAAARAMSALTALGLVPRVPVTPAHFADPDIREGWIRDKHMQVLSFYDPRDVAREVDVFVAYPLDFDAMVHQAVPRQVGTRVVPVAGVEHLIAMKRAAGRPQDLADVAALEYLQEQGLDHGD